MMKSSQCRRLKMKAAVALRFVNMSTGIYKIDKQMGEDTHRCSLRGMDESRHFIFTLQSVDVVVIGYSIMLQEDLHVFSISFTCSSPIDFFGWI